MVNPIEIGRFKVDGIEYIISYEKIMYEDIIIPYPIFMVSTKSSRRKRDKKPIHKVYEHYGLLKLDRPILVFRKIFKIFDDFLKNYNYVVFSAFDDATKKREKIYIKALTKMGFIHSYQHSIFWVVSRNNIKNKSMKKIKSVIDDEYGTF
jgi:hypothetical protein